MAMTIDEKIPVQGGGLGAMKVGSFVLGGKYVAGGVAFDIPEPELLIATNGFGALYDAKNKKVKLTYLKDAGNDGAVVPTEVKAGADVTGVELFYVVKTMF